LKHDPRNGSAGAFAARCFIEACELDVAVRKPGNVSRQSSGHGMQAALFDASARASAAPLFKAGARVGERIEAGVAATWAAVACNTNLGILLLCAPIARAFELQPAARGPAALREAIEAVLADLDVDDAAAAFAAIARANPAGLGTAPAQDVRSAPSITLRDAMALAAEHDSIARQYRDGYAELFELGVASAAGGPPEDGIGPDGLALPAAAAIVQRIYLAFLASLPDSHIVRKHGAPLAHSVMRSAQPWRKRAFAGEMLDADPAFAAWDLELKAAGLNPGTSADLTVASLFAAALARGATGRGP
jgi:triphosphoribosyl-dephospho-CoA synthase